MAPRPRTTSRALLCAVAVALLGACSSGSAEGGSCNRANGNADCASGLVCLSPLDVASTTAVCCPRPPATPSTAACAPANQDFHPNPAVDGSFAADGSGGTGGQEAGSDADAASDSPSDAPSDAASDSPSDAPNDAASDSPSDAPSDAGSDAPSDAAQGG